MAAFFRATTYFLLCCRMGEAARPGPDGEVQVEYADAAVEAGSELCAMRHQYITIGDGWETEAWRLSGEIRMAQQALVTLINLMAVFTGVSTGTPWGWPQDLSDPQGLEGGRG